MADICAIHKTESHQTREPYQQPKSAYLSSMNSDPISTASTVSAQDLSKDVPIDSSSFDSLYDYSVFRYKEYPDIGMGLSESALPKFSEYYKDLGTETEDQTQEHDGMDETTVKIVNVPTQLSEVQLQDICESVGPVLSTIIHPLQRTAFVVYENVLTAKQAVQNLDGFNTSGQKLVFTSVTDDTEGSSKGQSMTFKLSKEQREALNQSFQGTTSKISLQGPLGSDRDHKVHPSYDYRSHKAGGILRSYSDGQPPLELPRSLEPRPTLHTSLAELIKSSRRHDLSQRPSGPDNFLKGRRLPCLKDILSPNVHSSSRPAYNEGWGATCVPMSPIPSSEIFLRPTTDRYALNNPMTNSEKAQIELQDTTDTMSPSASTEDSQESSSSPTEGPHQFASSIQSIVAELQRRVDNLLRTTTRRQRSSSTFLKSIPQHSPFFLRSLGPILSRAYDLESYYFQDSSSQESRPRARSEPPLRRTRSAPAIQDLSTTSLRTCTGGQNVNNVNEGHSIVFASGTTAQKRKSRESEGETDDKAGRDDDDDSNVPRGKRRFDGSDLQSGKPLLPCIFYIGEPERYPTHRRKFEFIAELLRHLRSHDFFACSKCFSRFEDTGAVEAHKQNPCAKSCSRKCCKRHIAPGCERPSTCECIICPKDQWRELFRLQYQLKPIPDIFENQELDGSSNQDFNLESFDFNDMAFLENSVPINVTDGATEVDEPSGETSNNGGAALVQIDGSFLIELQLLRQRVQLLEQRINQPTERESDLEMVLGNVWQALVRSGSVDAQQQSPVSRLVRRFAPDILTTAHVATTIVQKNNTGLDQAADSITAFRAEDWTDLFHDPDLPAPSNGRRSDSGYQTGF